MSLIRGAFSAVNGRLERLIPTWRGNILIVGVIIFASLGYFLWQVNLAERTFFKQVKEHAQLISEAVQLNASNAVLAQSVIDEITQSFLGNTARFVDYLDAIEPFTEAELAAFCQQTGLAWAVIYRPEGATIGRSAPPASLHILPQATVKTYTLKREHGGGSIVIGFSSPRIQALERQIDLKQTLKRLERLSGIVAVRIEPTPMDDRRPQYGVRLIERQRIAETRLRMDAKQSLVVGVAARPYYEDVSRLWRQFLAFAALSIVIGTLVCWLLFYYQTTTLNQVRAFERRMARQQEDAALGQASATITHELRNPLNAISMGLQRLRIEADELTAEHMDLIDTMLKAMQRTNGIITNLGRYTTTFKPRHQEVDLCAVIEHLLTLYAGGIDARGIEVRFKRAAGGLLTGDQHLFEEMLENLIKNAIEAQPQGGYIAIALNPAGPMLALAIENAGFEGSEETLGRIFEPYYTTKTQGSGLGLAIAKRIVAAHGGSVAADIPQKGILRLHIKLPYIPGRPGNHDARAADQNAAPDAFENKG